MLAALGPARLERICITRTSLGPFSMDISYLIRLQGEEEPLRFPSMLSSVASLHGSASSRPVPYNQQIPSSKRLQHVPAHRSTVNAPCQETYGRQVPMS